MTKKSSVNFVNQAHIFQVIAISVGSLLKTQMQSLFLNRTTIEDSQLSFIDEDEMVPVASGSFIYTSKLPFHSRTTSSLYSTWARGWRTSALFLARVRQHGSCQCTLHPAMVWIIAIRSAAVKTLWARPPHHERREIWRFASKSIPTLYQYTSFPFHLHSLLFAHNLFS